jgi:predicted Na+-dependent transporter
MFLSRRDDKTTSTIKVSLGHDLLMSFIFTSIGLGLVICSITQPIEHWRALAVGLLLLLMGCSLGQATLRLIFRGWRAYDNATRKGR